MVRISSAHPGGPYSIPGMGKDTGHFSNLNIDHDLFISNTLYLLFVSIPGMGKDTGPFSNLNLDHDLFMSNTSGRQF